MPPARIEETQRAIHYEWRTRTFQVWSYTVGHRVLIVRSVKGDGGPDRITVAFFNTSRICIPTLFEGLRVEAKAAELEEDSADAQRTFVLSGHGWDGHVTAATVAIAEDDGEYDAPLATRLRRLDW